MANQNNLAVGSYNTETGFYNSSFPVVSGQGNVGLAGPADQGTRLLVSFQNVPSGVSLFTPVAPLITSGPDVLRLTNTDVNGAGPFSSVAGSTSGLAQIALASGSGIAVFEDLQSDPSTFATVNIPFYVAYDSSVALPGLATATVTASLAPYSLTTMADGTSPVPRFAFTGEGLGGAAFTINPCS